MKTLDEKIADLKAQHEKQVEELALKEKILSALPDWTRVYDVRVYCGELYGRIAAVHFDHNFFRLSTDTALQPDLELVGRLHEAFPGLPMVRVKDGSLSFRLKAHVEALPEEKKARWESETDVAPFRIDIDTHQQRTAEFEWYAEVAGVVVSFHVKLPLMSELGYLNMRAVRYGSDGPVKYWERCEFQPNNAAVYTLFSSDGESLADLQPCVKWGTGGREYPNNFTLFWVNHTENKTATVADLARQLIAEAKK